LPASNDHRPAHRRRLSAAIYRRRRITVGVAGLAVLILLGVGIGVAIGRGSGTPVSTRSAGVRRPVAESAPASTVAPTSTAASPTTTAPPTTTTAAPPATTSAPAGPLAGKVVAIDPGHNGGNAADPAFMDQTVFNGRTPENCDTDGASTDGGYPEHQFNWQVALDLQANLQAEGATVVLTRSSDTGLGPCVDQRAAIGNNAHANVAISIHADGGPASGRGFAILEPVADGPNDAIITSSDTFATDLRAAFLAGTGEPVSNYDGTDGLQPRDDLGGLNLSTVPKVLIECANMRNATDAALLVTDSWQHQAAAAMAQGITIFLRG
jgi:N-acetylmuramoyl-L-alanine amidase